MAWSKEDIPEFDVKVPRGKSFVVVNVKPTTKFSLGIIPQFLAKTKVSGTAVLEAINFLNHLFAVGPTNSLIPVGRKFFTDNSNDIRRDKGSIIEFRSGLFQSIHFGGDQSLTLNVDVTTGVFWNSETGEGKPMTALMLASYILGTKPENINTNLSTKDLNAISRQIKGVKYKVLHRGREFEKRQHSIAQIVRSSSRDYKFQLNDEHGRTISVEQYMKKTYNLTLKYPNALLILKNDSTYLPMELCYIMPVHTSLSDLMSC
jgi:hypothetical protein